MSTIILNGKPRRKQLCEQLDRLDSIIDVLADGLPSAVADATRDGTRQAVRDAVVEILSNPELRAMLAGIAPPMMPSRMPTLNFNTAPMPEAVQPKLSFWAKARAKLANLKRKAIDRFVTTKQVICDISKVAHIAVRSKLQSTKQAIVAKVVSAKASIVGSAKLLVAVLPIKKMLIVGISVGVIAGVISYFCPHIASAVISGCFAACTAASSVVALWLRRTFAMFGFGT